MSLYGAVSSGRKCLCEETPAERTVSQQSSVVGRAKICRRDLARLSSGVCVSGGFYRALALNSSNDGSREQCGIRTGTHGRRSPGTVSCGNRRPFISVRAPERVSTLLFKQNLFLLVGCRVWKVVALVACTECALFSATQAFSTSGSCPKPGIRGPRPRGSRARPLLNIWKASVTRWPESCSSAQGGQEPAFAEAFTGPDSVPKQLLSVWNQRLRRRSVASTSLLV